ncbi:hypothetical protein HPB47_028215 [Ixodes persulcatus]|uniref:Uncharacterized protein n=1 Tax=Ixodes persulcatus TaxID=34615 RepID=A0AC60PTW3_IXOPE|nr:hypothetical protein HPB47_028215 [Ixodes persulcatus]
MNYKGNRKLIEEAGEKSGPPAVFQRPSQGVIREAIGVGDDNVLRFARALDKEVGDGQRLEVLLNREITTEVAHKLIEEYDSPAQPVRRLYLLHADIKDLSLGRSPEEIVECLRSTWSTRSDVLAICAVPEVTTRGNAVQAVAIVVSDFFSIRSQAPGPGFTPCHLESVGWCFASKPLRSISESLLNGEFSNSNHFSRRVEERYSPLLRSGSAWLLGWLGCAPYKSHCYFLAVFQNLLDLTPGPCVCRSHVVPRRTVVTVVPWSYTQYIVVAMDPDLQWIAQAAFEGEWQSTNCEGRGTALSFQRVGLHWQPLKTDHRGRTDAGSTSAFNLTATAEITSPDWIQVDSGNKLESFGCDGSRGDLSSQTNWWSPHKHQAHRRPDKHRGSEPQERMRLGAGCMGVEVFLAGYKGAWAVPEHVWGVKVSRAVVSDVKGGEAACLGSLDKTGFLAEEKFVGGGGPRRRPQPQAQTRERTAVWGASRAAEPATAAPATPRPRVTRSTLEDPWVNPLRAINL